MSHTHLLKGLLLGEYCLEYSLKNPLKEFQILKKNSLHYYVKVYVNDFKIYVNFKSFEVHL